MSYAPIVVLLIAILLSGSDASAQCLCGSLRFTVVDSASGEMAPHPRGQIGRDSVSVVSGMFAVSLRSGDRVLRPDIASTGEKDLFRIPTDVGHDLLLLEIVRHGVLMTVEISHVAMDYDYLLDPITFRGGVYTLDLAKAKRIGDGYGFENVDSQLVLMRKLPRR